MNHRKIFAVVCGMSGSFWAGMFLGSYTMNRRMIEKLKKQEPLLANAMANVLKEIVDKDLSVEEIHVLLDREMAFIRQVLPY